jgi:hypothetical protein
VAYKLPLPPKTRKPAKAGNENKTKQEKPKPIRPTVNKGRAAWREFSGLFLQRSDANRAIERPRFLDQLSVLKISDQRLTQPFRCVALQTDGKMKFFEWLDFGFDVPPALLRDPDGALWTDDALNFTTDCTATIVRIFTHVFRGSSKKSSRFNRLKDAMEADYWQVMGEKFRNFVIDLANEDARSTRLDRWLDDARHEAQAVFDHAANATGDDGNTLRLIEEGKAKCRIALAALRNQTNQPLSAEGAKHDPTQQKTKRTKRTRR